MTTLALALGGLLAAAAVVFLTRPLLRRESASDVLQAAGDPDPERLALEEERDRALGALRELEFDHRTGKVSDEDYRTLVAELRQRASEALRALDRGGPTDRYRLGGTPRGRVGGPPAEPA